MSQFDHAKRFFEACETGKGWEGCKQYCHADATFSSQTNALADIDSLEGYTEWMKNLFTPIPDANYEVKSFSEDKERNIVTVFGVLYGTQTGEGGPVAPTGKAITAHYVYAMEFKDGLISHMTKVWNDGISMEQLGWA